MARLPIYMLLLVACSNQQQPITSIPLPCGKDSDCKDSRICSSSQCVSPSASQAPGPMEPTKILAQPAGTEPDSTTDPVPVCKAGDGRTIIPVWEPSADDRGNLSSDPPQNDGQIVYIRFYQDASKATCNDTELNSFNRPNNPDESMEGGLAVNIRGNTQFANGLCYFSGYYMNEDVMGIHQGWIETYYGAVDKKDIVLSSKYCFARSVE
jgi:hypothetical protein